MEEERRGGRRRRKGENFGGRDNLEEGENGMRLLGSNLHVEGHELLDSGH